VVVGCFAASAAPLHFCFNQNIPHPPYLYGRIEYAGNRDIVRPPSRGQNNNDGNDDGKKIAASYGMLTRKHTEPCCGPNTMAREGEVPANFL
jgi:hypothetical protein